MGLNIVIANILFVIFMVGVLVSFVKTGLELIISLTDSTVTKARLQQFNKGVKDEKASQYETVDSLTKVIQLKLLPTLQNVMPSLKMNNLDQLNKDLIFIGWDDTFNAESYVATGLALKAFGIIIAIVIAGLLPDFAILAPVVGAVVAFVLDSMFKGEVKNKRILLYADFPELVRIVSGYLMADMPLVKSIEESVKYVSDEWKPVLHQFIIDCDTKSTTVALDTMKDTVDMFEVREFVSLVKLTLEQGGEAKQSFEEQADKVAEMQKNQFLIQIGKRRTWASVVQGPTLLCNMVVLALPVMMNATSMM